MRGPQPDQNNIDCAGAGVAASLPSTSCRHTCSFCSNDSVMRYTYDQNGNVASIADQYWGVSNRTMGYDGLDRLTSVAAPALWGTASYSYDALDNLTGSTVTAGGTARSTVFNYPDPATNRLTSVTGSAGYNFSYAYDGQGNITQRGAQQYVFDQGNRLTAAPGVATYRYDGLGHRISVIGNDGVNRVQLYSQGGQMLQAGPAGGAATRFIYLHNHVIAEVSAAGTEYLHTDALGSPVARTNSAGTLISQTKYEPYGKTAQGATPTLGFTGHVNDADTGLVYMQQRYYDPVAGRFLSVDPVVTDANTGHGFNRFAYAVNNPYSFTDPDGREEKPVDREAERQRERQAKETKRLCDTGQCDGVSTVRSSEPGESRSWGSYLPGTAAGESAAQYWADRQVQTGNDLYAIPGVFASLWTPDTAIATAATLLGGGGASVGVRLGREVKFGSNFRFAPFGNRTGNKFGELPHYHRRGVDPSTGKTWPGHSIGRHRPWETKSTDKSFWDRF